MRLKTIFYLMLVSLLCFSCSNKHEEKEYEFVEIEQICKDCYGEGYVMDYCNECNGSGGSTYYSSRSVPIVCSDCYGIGEVICSRCGGKAKDPRNCSNCNRGQISCIVCNGRGIVSTRGSNIICPVCDGTRHITCNSCHGNYFKSERYCCGDGSVTCNKCFGTGYSGRKKVEERGFETCSYCNGTGGERERCSTCQGIGRIKILEMRQY